MQYLKTLVVVVLFFLSGCVPPQHRLDFDLTKNALVSCDKQLKIRHVTITEKDGDNRYVIDLKQNNEGSYVVYLDKENEGYYCNDEYPLKFKPNKEYIISSVSLDSGLEMSVFTNSDGKIDSVANPLGCIKEKD
jgi:hypothetical protein